MGQGREGKVMITKDANLKFKTVMRDLREKHRKTRKQVAKGIGVTESKYLRMESITSAQKITLNEAAKIYDYYSVEAGFREILTFLPNSERDEVISRVLTTVKFLDNLTTGDISIKEVREQAVELRKQYKNTMGRLAPFMK